jgi:predicted AAA+ superfamily ATPase
MRPREAASALASIAAQYPVVTITGPRQSGKTTLAKQIFAEHRYVSLEDPDVAAFARTDPRGFLDDMGEKAILDEIQREPPLLSYLQRRVDEDPTRGRYILTGSQNLALGHGVSQSLAGRTGLLTLLPFTLREAWGDRPADLDTTVFRGFYPRIHDRDLEPSQALAFYVATYVERDVRSLSHIQDLTRFQTFLGLCAGRTAQILNYSDLAADAGISVNSAKNWISVLEASYLVRRLMPYHANISSRLSKSPKLYFLDVGLAAWLLGIRDPSQLRNHPLRGALFETMMVAEAWKAGENAADPSQLFYYRDSTQREIDLVQETGSGLDLFEIKSGRTVTTDWFKHLAWGRAHLERVDACHLVYGGDERRVQSGIHIHPWTESGFWRR